MTSQNEPKTDAEIAAPHFQHPQSQSQQPAYGQITGVPDDLGDIRQQLQEAIRRIGDLENKRINLNTDIIGLFETVSTAPTLIPVGPYDQIKVYVNGATLRLYWYDSVAHVWHYVTATA